MVVRQRPDATRGDDPKLFVVGQFSVPRRTRRPVGEAGQNEPSWSVHQSGHLKSQPGAIAEADRRVKVTDDFDQVGLPRYLLVAVVTTAAAKPIVSGIDATPRAVVIAAQDNGLSRRVGRKKCLGGFT